MRGFNVNFFNKKIFGFMIAFSFIFLVSVSSALASFTVYGDFPDTGLNYRVEAYNASQSNMCDGVADTGTLMYFSSAYTTGDSNYDDDDDYNETYAGTLGGATTVYFYMCGPGGNSAAKVVDFTKTVNDGDSLEIDLGYVQGGSAVHDDLVDDYIYVCDNIGGNEISSVSKQADASTAEYTQYYYIDKASLTTAYIFFDNDTSSPCVLDSTKEAGKLIKINTAQPDNYGVYVTFEPDTKAVGDLHSDLTNSTLELFDSNGYSIGLVNQSASGQAADGLDDGDDDYDIYYDKPSLGDLTLNITPISLGNEVTTVSGIDKDSFTSGYDFINDIEDDNADGIPSTLNKVEVIQTIGSDSITITTAPRTSGSIKLFDLFVDNVTASTGILFKVGDTLKLNISDRTLTDIGDEAIAVAKISGTVHSGIGSGGNDQIQIHTAATCTAGSVVSSETIYGNSSASPNYEIYFEDTDAIVYMSIAKDGTYTTCGNKIAAATFDTDQTATINLDVEVAGTVPSGINRAAIDAGTASDATDASACAAYSDVSSGKYYIYGTTSSDSAVTLDNSGNVFFVASGALATELLERTKDLTTDQTVNVARVNGTDSNINSDFYGDIGTYINTEVRVSDEDTINGTDLLSSETVYIDSSNDNTTTDDTYIQYFEVPTDSYVNIILYNDSATVMYVYNFSASAGGEYTFEPKYKVAATVHSDINGINIAQSDGGGYVVRDATGESNVFNLYIDKTEEEADNNYTYSAYNDTSFANLKLSKTSKDVSTASTWGVSRLTGSAHANLQETNAGDNIEVFENSDCTNSKVSSENIVVGSTYYQYFEADAGGENLYVKVTDNDGTNSYVTCVNIEDTDATKGESISYNFNQLVYGNVPSDINYVAMDNDGNSVDWEYYQTPVTATTPDTFKIYTNGTADTDVEFKSGGSSGTVQLIVTGQDTTDGEQINVGKVSGNSLAVLSTAVVYNTNDCSTGQLSSESEDPGTTYSQYFEDDGSGTFYISVGDGTNTTCLSSGFTLTNQEASDISFNRTLLGIVPDQDSTTIDLLSVSVDTGANTYWSNTVNGASTNSYKIYVDSVDTSIATTGIVFKNTTGGAGTTILSLTKDLSSDATADVSCVYGNRQTDIQGAGEVSYVCYGTLPTSNQACSSRASTVSAGAGSTYELFFEQISGTSIYFVEVADSDTQTYYSWNNFTSSSAGSYVNVELDGKLSGYVQDSNSDRVPGVQVSLYTNGGDPTDDRVSLTFTYPGTTSPGGNYRMYGNLTTTYDVQFTKAGYITNTNTSLAALTTTYNPTMANGIAVTVQDETGNPITDATVAIYNCTDSNPANCDYTATAVVSKSTADDTTNGIYYFNPSAVTTYIGIKVSRTNYTTQYDPTNDAATNDNQISTSTTITETFNLVYVGIDITKPTLADGDFGPTTDQTDTTPLIYVGATDDITANASLTIELSVNGETETMTYNATSKRWEFTPGTALTDADYTNIYVKITDEAGNWISRTWNFYVNSDNTGPTMAATANWPGSTVTTEPFWIVVNVTESDLMCEYYIISNTTDRYVDSGDLAEFDESTYGTVQGTKLANIDDDNYTLTFVCEDVYGNTNTLDVAFTVAINNYNYTQWLRNIWDKLWLPDESIMTNMSYSDFNITNILSSIDGYYEEVYYYNGSAWACYSPTLGWNGSDLQYANNTNDKPYWVKLNTTALGANKEIRFTM